jgi:CHAD domain-containing protein
VRPDDTAGRAFERILGGEAWKMRANLRGAVHDLHPEYVHDLRVAARRARSAVRLFSVVSGTEAGGALTEELAWIARLLGAARDLDVFSARLDEQFDRVEADPEFRETIRERLRARRTPAVARLAEALRSERFSSLLHRLESSSGSSEAAGEPAVHFCRRRIQKAFTKLELWIDRPADTLSGSELHRVRILFKRLRYACEFFRPVLGSDAGRLIGSFVGFQDCLGLHQDAVTCLHMLGGVLAETPGEIRSERFLITMGALQQVQRGIQADQRAVFAERWETARELLDVWKKVRDTRGGTV